MYLLIDNYDSFTYNLADILRRLGKQVEIFFNDQVALEAIEAKNYEGIIISPGPSHPENAGNIIEVIKTFYKKKPILGICLGHQAIGAAMALPVVKCNQVMHGKVDRIHRTSDPIFDGIEADFRAVRYHSLVIDKASQSDELMAIATAESDSEIMAVKHKAYPTYGFQFHPESYETHVGEKLMTNFFKIADAFNQTIDQDELDKTALKADDILNLRIPDEDIKSYLMALNQRGARIEDISGFAKAMKMNAMPLLGDFNKIGDTCGTGGDGLHTYNISTCSAFVLAAAGIPIAKHGNRSVSSLCGSADVLEALGANIMLSPSEANAVLEHSGIVFLFAQQFHPKMKHIMPIRKSIEGPTIFNMIGPLSNPVSLTHQIIGVYNRDHMKDMLSAMIALGVKNCAVLHGFGGMDELSLEGPNEIMMYHKGEIIQFELDPRTYGFTQIANSALKGGDAAHNAAALKRTLEGNFKVFEDIVVLNAGFSMYVFEDVDSIEAGFQKARGLIQNGSALSVLNQFIVQSQAV